MNKIKAITDSPLDLVLISKGHHTRLSHLKICAAACCTITLRSLMSIDCELATKDSHV